jgi:uncharacterized protein
MEPTGTDAPVVTDNPAKSRFELHVGGELAGFVTYRLRGADGQGGGDGHGGGGQGGGGDGQDADGQGGGGQVIDLLHTEVDDRFQGAGLAGKLARASLDAARARHLRVLPTCPYIRSWIRKHPDYADLVPQERRAQFGV